jgi:hypothetical protein
MKQVLLMRVLLFGILFTTSFASNKRGLSWPSENKQDSPNLFTGGNVKWFYNWSADKNSNVNLEFVPMLWGEKWQNPADFPGKVQSQGAKVILGFNEPERSDQANMSPDRAAALWKQYVEPLAGRGVRLGSPAVASTEEGLQWLQNFLSRGCKVDFLALHWYGTGVDNFINFITNARNRLGNQYPVWVTEFAPTSWNAGQPLSQNEINSFFDQSIGRLEQLNWVERYAWFGAKRSFPNDLGSGIRLIGDNGQLSDLGNRYVHGLSRKRNFKTRSHKNNFFKTRH